MAGPGDDLFMALAQAKARPSKALRAVESAGQAGNDILGGYAQGQHIIAARNEAALKPYEIWTKISDSAGPDVANSIFRQRGIPVPEMPSSGGSDYTPDQLSKMGSFGKTRLGNMKTTQEMQNNMPFPTDVSVPIGQGDTDALTKIHADRGETVPFREMNAAISAKRSNLMGGMVDLRGANAIMSSLPSHQPPGSPAGAASGVQLAVRQGKGLIANPSSDPKRIGLASLDTARAVLRAAPQLDAINGANYSDTLANTLNNLGNRFSSGQMAPADIPGARKQIFDALTELENSSRPLIARELAQTERVYGPQGHLPKNWDAMKKSELGLDLPDIPFNPGVGSSQNPNISTGVPQGKVKVSNGKQSFYVDPSSVAEAQKDGFMPQ